MAGFFGMGNYQNSGTGISKNAPKKGRLKLFFEILGVRIWKLFTLNLIYVLCCIPVITIGPATAGITKVLKNYSIDKNAYVWLDFKDAFKENFFKALFVGIFDVIAFSGAAAGCYLYPKMAEASGSNVYYAMFAITLSVAITFTIMNFYVYLMMVSTDLSMKNIIKNSLYLTFLAPKQNLISIFFMVLITAVFLLLIIFVNFQFAFLLPFAPATFIAFIICYNCYPIVQKYVIDPYYENRGEKNPEAPVDYEADNEEALFKDMGGKEKPVEVKKKSKKGKIIS